MFLFDSQRMRWTYSYSLSLPGRGGTVHLFAGVTGRELSYVRRRPWRSAHMRASAAKCCPFDIVTANRLL